MKSRIARRVEAELGDDLDGKSGRFGGCDLFRERALQLVVADARMAFGIAGNADGADAAPAEHAEVDRIEGAAKRPAFAAVAGDDQHVLDAGLAVEPCQKIIERLALAKLRTATCGTGSKPAARTRTARSSNSSPADWARR